MCLSRPRGCLAAGRTGLRVGATLRRRPRRPPYAPPVRESFDALDARLSRASTPPPRGEQAIARDAAERIDALERDNAALRLVRTWPPLLLVCCCRRR